MSVTKLQTVDRSAPDKASGAVSDRVAELNTEMKDSLDRLNTLIDNRSAWADGIEGCRESVVILGRAQSQLQAILETARRIEADLASARSELERWSKMHAELSTVERDLRAECDRYSAAIEEQRLKRAHLRSLAEKLFREIAS